MKPPRNIIALFTFLFIASVGPGMAQENPTVTTPAQVILEPHMVQIILNDEHRDGVDWEAIVSDFHALSLKDENSINDIKNKLSAGSVSNEDYAVLLEALDAVGRITQTEQEPLTLIEDSKVSLEFQTEEAKNKVFIDVNLTLTSKEEKQLGISASFLGKTGTTTIDLKENSTIVLGSIFYEHEVTRTHKFPLLGDLPIVGLVFRKKGKLMQKVETIIFLTPKGQ